MNLNVHPIILSGGSGTRLWPLSRAMYPKQFINFFNGSGDGTTFLGSTIDRLSPELGFAPPTLLCNNDHRFLVREELDKREIEPRAIILEPVARNTAAAIAVAAVHVAEDNPNAILAVMPSDHMIRDEERFRAAIEKAAEVAATGRLVLFGIEPDHAHTGYGYIRRGDPIPSYTGAAFEVSAFTEKPDQDTAKKYIASGDHYWNSGIFVLHARTFLEELGQLEPKIFAAAEGAMRASARDFEFTRLDKAAFSAAPSISVDYAVMERTRKAAMIPVDMGWNDVGSWSSLWDVAPRDDKDNFVHGDAILKDTGNCYVHSEKSLVSTIGVDNLVIVDTPDALLVADKSRAQDVGEIVKELKLSNRKEQEQHLRNFRPWGYFETLSIGPRFQVKKLHVKPGGKLSMQMHHHRSEHWVVVQGTATVHVGDMEKLVRENESIYIFATQWHRLENPGKVPLELIEVQIGTYLGEDDIVRTDDVYHRSADETK
ncbi:MAG: mannose-1-phosphate guanylyltransferase/mannose-6-phosphate isomerase [Pseudomonadota bacterium]